VAEADVHMRLATNEEEAQQPGTTEGGGARMRGETVRDAGRGRQSEGGRCTPSLGETTEGAGRWWLSTREWCDGG